MVRGIGVKPEVDLGDWAAAASCRLWSHRVKL